MATKKEQRRIRIKKGIRKKLSGSNEMPRLSVFKSNKRIYVQLIDDVTGKTILSADSTKLEGGCNMSMATAVGQEIAKKATEKGINSVVFDRNGYLYHGKIKALADGAREGGLKF